MNALNALNTNNLVSNLRRRAGRVAFVAALAGAGLASAMPASALSVKQLAGAWQAAIIANGGCGVGSKVVTFTLNTEGAATNAVETFNTPTCGEGTQKGTFTVTSLSADGSGKATLDFGGNVFNFVIQVNSTANEFNMVEITDSGNYELGTAILQ